MERGEVREGDYRARRFYTCTCESVHVLETRSEALRYSLALTCEYRSKMYMYVNVCRYNYTLSVCHFLYCTLTTSSV